MSVEKLICQLTGAEDALVVNNCAAATVLMLTALAQDQSVVISRGQLVEIGGGFRIPDIMVQSRARLIEVGTTNRTRISDYEKALNDHDDIAALLRVHSSNFKMVGFTHEIGVSELVALTARREPTIPVLDDIGSGAVLDTQAFGLSHEPMPQESIKAGAAIVTFSGDKLLGGPQAGVLAGKRESINRCRLHPLARAFRADKYTLAALGATILHYLRGEATREVPVWRMIAMHKDDISLRSKLLIQHIDPWLQRMGITAVLADGESTVGGGSLPGETLPTTLVVLHSTHAIKLANTLRAAPVPIITRIQEDHVLLDLRTVLDDAALTDAILNIP